MKTIARIMCVVWALASFLGLAGVVNFLSLGEYGIAWIWFAGAVFAGLTAVGCGKGCGE